MTNRVKKGTRFRSVIGDCNALWEVRSSRGAKCWVCVVVNETWEHDGKTYDSDFVSQTEVFSEEKILRILKLDQFWQKQHQKHVDFFAGLQPDQTVHYHNGFDDFVRCTVVATEKGNMLKPVAMVGQWREHDLPRRNADGTIELGYHAKQVVEGKLFKPNASCIVENPEWQPSRTRYTKEQIAALPAISPDVQPMNEDEQKLADMFKFRKAIIERLEQVDTLEKMTEFQQWICHT